MKSLGSILNEMGVTGFTIKGIDPSELPTTEAEFNACFEILTGTNESGTAIYSNDPQDFPVTWDGVQAAIAAQTDAARVADIKAEARRIILERYSENDQRNMLAVAARITRIDEVNRTPEQETILDELDAAFAWVESVRATSDQLETDPTADFKDRSLWPE